jgi:hypothetical protein
MEYTNKKRISFRDVLLFLFILAVNALIVGILVQSFFFAD